MLGKYTTVYGFVCSPAHVFVRDVVCVFYEDKGGPTMSSSSCFGVFIFHKILQRS